MLCLVITFIQQLRNLGNTCFFNAALQVSRWSWMAEYVHMYCQALQCIHLHVNGYTIYSFCHYCEWLPGYIYSLNCHRYHHHHYWLYTINYAFYSHIIKPYWASYIACLYRLNCLVFQKRRNFFISIRHLYSSSKATKLVLYRQLFKYLY